MKTETGKVEAHFLNLDLADIKSATAAAKEYMSKEGRLDLLFNSGYYLWQTILTIRGVMNTAEDAKTPQGYEMQWVNLTTPRHRSLQGTNVVGHFVFTKELLPLLLSTAKEHPGRTRVVWISSNGHGLAPKEIINFDDVNLTKETGWTRYGQSKAV